MTAVAQDSAILPFWSDRPLSYGERKLVVLATSWIEHALQSTNRPVFFLTLTCRQAQTTVGGGLVWLTKELLSDALEVYFRRIDKLVYGNAWRRFRKGVQRFVVLEGGSGTGKQLHVHMLVVAPPAQYIEPLTFIGSMLTTWRSSPWGRHDRQEKHDVDWRPVHDLQGAIQYLLKTGMDAVALSCTNF